MDKPKERLYGFTLVELLVVISVIGLLLSILLPSLQRARSGAMAARCMRNLGQINLAINLYMETYNQTYPCPKHDPLSPNLCFWMGRGWRPSVEPYLGGSIDANNPSVLWCPQDKTDKDKYKSTSYAYSMSFYYSSSQIDTFPLDPKHLEQVNGPGPGIDITPQKATAVASPGQKILIGEWESNHVRIEPDDRWWCKGWWSWDGSRNYLFADGHTSMLRARDVRQARDGTPNPNLTHHGIKGTDWPAN